MGVVIVVVVTPTFRFVEVALCDRHRTVCVPNCALRLCSLSSHTHTHTLMGKNGNGNGNGNEQGQEQEHGQENRGSDRPTSANEIEVVVT